jgi:2-oxoisovalerate ferredoxin oxidoreductase beta subunit
MIKHKKPASFYDEFTRKGPGQKTTHYCPGCGHGVVHKMMAEAITDLEIQDKVVFLSPVGCAVFLYYYMDTGNIQCPHGRAPAVATGVTRTLEDAIVISYQGDGDLAGIGTAEIIHAANRGENMAVIFINNAIYGMTGGQMAPTTLIGQTSKTTPLGRDAGRDGLPIKMCEIMNELDAPVYVERTSLGTPSSVLKTRKAIIKALNNQKDKKGFSFVEILSPCPINWNMDPIESRKWLIDNLEPFYPVKNFRDINKQDRGEGRLPFMSDDALLKLLDVNSNDSDDLSKNIKKIGIHKVKIAGFGGQGIMSVGVLLANCAKEAGYNSTWLPSYGPEMRGGTASANIVISDETIGSPLIDTADVLIAMNAPSLDKFEDDVIPGGIIIVNSSLVSRKVKRKDVKVYYMPATEMANEVGLTATAAVIILAAYTKIADIYDLNTLKKVLPLSIKKEKYMEINKRAITSGELFYDNNPMK